MDKITSGKNKKKRRTHAGLEVVNSKQSRTETSIKMKKKQKPFCHVEIKKKKRKRKNTDRLNAASLSGPRFTREIEGSSGPGRLKNKVKADKKKRKKPKIRMQIPQFKYLVVCL